MTAGPAPETALVGHERELAALRAGAYRRRGGPRQTALAEALLAEARERGALVLVERCYDLAETPPYGPWAEGLASAPPVPDIPAPPGFAEGEHHMARSGRNNRVFGFMKR